MHRTLSMCAALVVSSVTLLGQSARLTSAEIQALAEEAYLFAYPMLENYRTMNARATAGLAFNQWTHARALAGPEARQVIRPNNDTLYSSAWLDLRAEPMVITMPAVPGGRYWSIQLIDLYTHNIAIVSARNAPSSGERYLVAGPSWRGSPPSGMTQVVYSETAFVFALIRFGVQGTGDLVNVAPLQAGLRASALSAELQTAAPPAPPALTLPPYEQEQAQSEGFIQYLNVMLGQLAIHPSEADLIARFGRIGIGPDRPFDAAALDPQTRGAIRRGVTSALDKISGSQSMSRVARGTWTTAGARFGSRERMQGRYLDRSSAARFGLYGLDREEAVYMNAGVDASGAALDGSRATYSVRFAPGTWPPARAFWSITMYDADGFLVANPINRYSIGDRTPDLRHDPDGSLTIWITAARPDAARAANWLPSPAGRFALSLRIYLPDERVDTYVPPPVQKVN